MKVHARLAAIALVALVAVGCGGDDDEDPAAASTEQTQELTSVKYGFSVQNSVLWHPYYVAQEMGYFEDEGLDVEFVTVSGASGVLQQLAAGNVDIAVSAGPATLSAIDADQDVRWYYTYIHEILNSMVVLDDSDIETLEDLKGKTVGISAPSGGEVPVLRGMMSSVGMTEGSDYSVIAVGEGGQLTYQALESGQVDAYISSIFDVSALSNAGLPVRDILPDEFRLHPGLGDVAMAETLAERPEILTAFSRAIARGTLFSETNPEAAKAIAEKAMPELFADADLAGSWWDAVVPKMQIPEAADSDLYGANYIEAWSHYIDLASQGDAAEGALLGDYDLETIVDSSLLEDINDFDHDAVVEDAKNYEG